MARVEGQSVLDYMRLEVLFIIFPVHYITNVTLSGLLAPIGSS